MNTRCLCVLLVAGSSISAQEAFRRADIDQRGRLHIVTSEGREIVPPLGKDQIGFARVAISKDRRTVGWFADFQNCCTTYPVALKLVVYRDGRQRTFTGNDLAFARWAFADSGTRVAFRQETVHGGLAVHYELRDVATGRLVAGFDPAGERAKPPTWVRALDAVNLPDEPPRLVVRSLPRAGLAVRDSTGKWCAEFVADSLAPALPSGGRVTIVFAGPAAFPSLRALVVGAQSGQCPAEFPQPRWLDYRAYRLELLDRPAAAGGESPGVALILAGDAAWVRGTDGVVRADLDGDGVPEEARRCLADEGEHFTLWSTGPTGKRVRRWHEYFDWGALTARNCAAGEAGTGPPSD